MRRIVLALLVAFLTTAPLRVAPLSAQSADEIADRYAQLALERSLSLQASEASLAASAALLDEGRAAFRPTVGMQARYSRADGGRQILFPVGDLLNPVYDALNGLVGAPGQPGPFPQIDNVQEPFLLPQEQDTRLQVTQLLFSRAAGANVRASEAGLRSTEANRDAVAATVHRDVATAYHRWRNAERAIRILDEALVAVVEAERVTERRVETDLDTPDRLFRARAERLSVEQRLQEATAAERDAAGLLNYLLDRAPQEALDRPGGEEDPADLVARAERLLAEVDATMGPGDQAPARPELAAATAAVEVAEAGLAATDAERWPTLVLAVDAGIQGPEYGIDSQDRFVLGSLVMTWRPFQGGAISARQARRAAEKNRLEATRRDTARSLRLALEQAERNLRTALASVETALARELEAERGFRLVARRTEEGLGTQLEFLDARSTLTSARLNVHLTLDAVRMRMVELRYAAGTLRPTSETDR